MHFSSSALRATQIFSQKWLQTRLSFLTKINDRLWQLATDLCGLIAPEALFMPVHTYIVNTYVEDHYYHYYFRFPSLASPCFTRALHFQPRVLPYAAPSIIYHQARPPFRNVVVVHATVGMVVTKALRLLFRWRRSRKLWSPCSTLITHNRGWRSS